jgi:N-acetylglucosaminyl-diphospho-decaprenol L-rhamnosyltransferase
MTRVRIGIVSWNTAGLLDRCLGAIPAAAEGLEFDVVVVDNHSSDASEEVARRHSDVTVVSNDHNIGYARAMNQAIAYRADGSSPEVLIALNPDTVAPPQSLTRLVAHLLAEQDVGLVAPRLINRDGSHQHSVYRFPSPLAALIVCTVPLRLQRGRLARRWWLEGRVPHDTACDIDWAIGAVHVMRASAVHALGPYCERWFMYVEDMDLCWSLHQQGWRCRLEPDTSVLHVGNASGELAWGDSRSSRWWEATYDWYRLRRGVPSVRRWALMNSAGVLLQLAIASLRRVSLGARKGADAAARMFELRSLLPLHLAMVRAPSTKYLPVEDACGPGARAEHA